MGDRLTAERTVELASGTTMPLLGLGTWQARGSDAVNAARFALAAGYRHIDTATITATSDRSARRSRRATSLAPGCS